jgi:hypothetical protein
VKDLSVHRSTARLFESAATARRSTPSWLGPLQTVRLLVTTLAGLTAATLTNPAIFAQDSSPAPSKSVKKTAAVKPGLSAPADESGDDSPQKGTPKSSSGKAQPPADDSQGTADQPTSVFAISKPLMTDEAWKLWYDGKGRADYNRVVHTGELGDRDSMQAISNGIEAQVKAMSLPTQRENLARIVAELLRSVHMAADQKDPGAQRTVRVAMVKEIIKRCHELEDNQFYVRLNAAILLGNLFVVAENPANRITAEFYTEAFDPLMDVLGKPGQPEAIKVAAVNGLRNVALYANPPLEPSQKIRLAAKLRDELDKPDTCEWYQERLCETLGSLDQLLDLDGKPFIVQALAKALFDHNRPLCARAAAAKALGRAPLPETMDLNVVAYGIANLSRQIVEARNEKKKHVRRWCIMDVYLAFQPKNAAEKARRAGLLDRVNEPTFQKYKESIKDVYGLIRPMVAQDLKEMNSAFPSEVSDHIAEWIKNHTPAQLRIAPGLPPIATTQVTKTEK